MDFTIILQSFDRVIRGIIFFFCLLSLVSGEVIRLNLDCVGKKTSANSECCEVSPPCCKAAAKTPPLFSKCCCKQPQFASRLAVGETSIPKMAFLYTFKEKRSDDAHFSSPSSYRLRTSIPSHLELSIKTVVLIL